MSRGDGLDFLKPFLPGLEAALEDPDVSEIMINGPGNVWLEGHGRLRQIDAPAEATVLVDRFRATYPTQLKRAGEHRPLMVCSSGPAASPPVVSGGQPCSDPIGEGPFGVLGV